MRAHRFAVAVAIVVSCVALAACSPKGNTLPAPTSSASDAPTLEAAVAGYNAMLAELRDAVSTEYPDATWRKDVSQAQKTGGGTDGTWRVLSPTWVIGAPIADDEAARDAIVQKANGILHAHGFVDLQTLVAKPGQFAYVADDRWGTKVDFGGSKLTTLDYRTGDLPSSDPAPQKPLGPELGG